KHETKHRSPVIGHPTSTSVSGLPSFSNMPNFNNRHTYNFPTAIRFGAGVIDELPAYLAQHELSRPLLVTDGLVAQLPFFGKIKKDLSQQGISVEVFSDMHKNP